MGMMFEIAQSKSSRVVGGRRRTPRDYPTLTRIGDVHISLNGASSSFFLCQSSCGLLHLILEGEVTGGGQRRESDGFSSEETLLEHLREQHGRDIRVEISRS